MVVQVRGGGRLAGQGTGCRDGAQMVVQVRGGGCVLGQSGHPETEGQK